MKGQKSHQKEFKLKMKKVLSVLVLLIALSLTVFAGCPPGAMCRAAVQTDTMETMDFPPLLFVKDLWQSLSQMF